MGYFRAFTVVPKSSERKIRAKLRKYCSPIRIFESQDHLLLTYESRYFPRLSPQTTFTMAVDARNLGYFKRGRTSLGKKFEAIMKFTMGISVSHSRKGEIPDAGQELLRKLEALCSSWEIDEHEDRINLRFDVLLDESAEPRKHIRRLAQILERTSIPYGAAIVTSAYSIVEGELPDSGLFCGPDVYVQASQDDVELLLNESESMLDGMDVDHWKRKRGHNGYYIELPLQPREE
jgi:hypothetical protein